MGCGTNKWGCGLNTYQDYTCSCDGCNNCPDLSGLCITDLQWNGIPLESKPLWYRNKCQANYVSQGNIKCIAKNKYALVKDQGAYQVFDLHDGISKSDDIVLGFQFGETKPTIV